MARELLTARLTEKICLSEVAECYHFRFELEGPERFDLERFDFKPGQWISAVAEGPNGKQMTRAYSLASAAHGNSFELCVNRVEGGVFSNFLCDMPVGDAVKVNGPHGSFHLKEPIVDSILVATGTGVAPIRGFVQWLFPDAESSSESDRSEGKDIWLVYGTRHETDIYYRQEFEALARRKPNFHYLPTLSRAKEDWAGLRGYVQEHVAKIVEDRAARLGQKLPLTPLNPAIPAAELKFDVNAYVCGLNFMVSSVRETLAGFGWHKKQIVFERYD